MKNNELLLVFPMGKRFRKPLYELGLLGLSFTPAKEENLSRKPRSSTPMFPSDNFHTVQHIKFKKQQTDLMSFFSAFSKLVQPYGIKPIADVLDSPDHPNLLIRINSEILDTNTFINLPLSLANLFKLPARQIWKGTLLASDIASQLEFEEVAMGTEFDVQIVTSPDAENRIIVQEEVDQMFFMRAPSTRNYKEFFAKISTKFYELNYSLAFDFTDNNSCRVSVHSLQQTPNDLVIIPQSLADALGLETTRLTSGVHESLQPFQFEKFLLIKEGDRLWFTYNRSYTTIYNMNEPAKKDYESMIRAINVSLNENYLPYLRIKFEYDGDGLRLTEGPDTVKVTLPKAVNEFYGFPMDTVFQLQTWMPLPKNIQEQITEDEIKREQSSVTPQPETKEPPKHLIVQCNVVDSSIVEGRDTPTLRVLHNVLTYGEKKPIYWSGDPVIYCGLNKEHIWYLKLRLLTDQGTPVELDPNTETTATILFRQIA